MTNEIFLTGSTGFVGKRLLEELIRRRPQAAFWLLIRSDGKIAASERFTELLREVRQATNLSEKEAKERLHLVEGDLELPNLGLSEGTRKEIASRISEFFHCAATVRLEGPLEDARRLNVEGTRSVVGLARLAHEKTGIRRFNHVSTAYVAGRRKGIIYETELDLGQRHINTYERAKMEAEVMLQAEMQRLPVTIFRPSMVMGDSKTGWTSSFNVLYAPIKLCYFGKLGLLPGCDRSRIDTVPIDFVATALAYLSSLDAPVIGKTFHLTVGQGRAISAVELFDHCRRHLEKLVDDYGLKNPRRIPTMIHPLVFRALNYLAANLTLGATRKVYRRFLTYGAYALFYKEFNTDQARALLEPAGIIPPKAVEYLDILCKYCVDTHFGTADGPRDVLG